MKPLLTLSREMWDDLSTAARADLQTKYEVRVKKSYYGEY